MNSQLRSEAWLEDAPAGRKPVLEADSGAVSASRGLADILARH